MIEMSSDLQWQLLRNNSSFLVKKNGYVFTSEPANLLQKNSFKYSGLANKKAISISASEKGILFSTKDKSTKKFALCKSSEMKKGSRQSAGAIKKVSEALHYRPDLAKAAAARASALIRSKKAPKPIQKKKLRGSKNKAQ